jgi:hypothetical protein
MVLAVDPLNVVPDASPPPPLLKVADAGVDAVTEAHAKVEPSHLRYVSVVVGALINDVALEPVWYGIR